MGARKDYMFKSIISFTINLMVLTIFITGHFFLFNYYDSKITAAESCEANLVVLQTKYDSALIKESTVTAYVSDNLWPSIKSKGAQVVDYVRN
jgi:hypothetical protein